MSCRTCPGCDNFVDVTQGKQLRARPTIVSLMLIGLTVLLGIAIRFGPLGLSWLIRKYGGSVLWAATLYWVISALLGRARLPVVALLAETVAVAVEFFKRVHTPELDRFRTTIPGILLLGREFSYTDLLAYSVAIGAAVMLDACILKRYRSL